MGFREKLLAVVPAGSACAERPLHRIEIKKLMTDNNLQYP
jgi:hypothetical protein